MTQVWWKWLLFGLIVSVQTNPVRGQYYDDDDDDGLDFYWYIVIVSAVAFFTVAFCVSWRIHCMNRKRGVHVIRPVMGLTLTVVPGDARLYPVQYNSRAAIVNSDYNAQLAGHM